MRSEKIGTSELKTAAVPESMYCSPQLMRKMGSPAFTKPRRARWPTWPRVGRVGRVNASRTSMATAPSIIRSATRVAGGSSSTAILIQTKDDPQMVPNKRKAAGRSQRRGTAWAGGC